MIWTVFWALIWLEQPFTVLYDLNILLHSYMIWTIFYVPMWFEQSFTFLYDLNNLLRPYIIWTFFYIPLWYEQSFRFLYDLKSCTVPYDLNSLLRSYMIWTMKMKSQPISIPSSCILAQTGNLPPYRLIHPQLRREVSHAMYSNSSQSQNRTYNIIMKKYLFSIFAICMLPMNTYKCMTIYDGHSVLAYSWYELLFYANLFWMKYSSYGINIMNMYT